MRVPRAAITSVFDAICPRMSPLRRILREAGLEVLRPVHKLPPLWQRFVKSSRFTRSRLWSRLRYDFLRDNDGRCQCCGLGANDGEKLNVDHILIRKTHPQFALAYANLQVMCCACNEGKGNRDQTDWRFRAGANARNSPGGVGSLAVRTRSGQTRPRRMLDDRAGAQTLRRKSTSPPRRSKPHWAHPAWRRKGCRRLSS